MALDPASPFPTTSDGRTAGRLAELERRVATLERGAPTIQTVAGAPTTSPRNGTPALDQSNVRLYLRVNGAWRYTTLT